MQCTQCSSGYDLIENECKDPNAPTLSPSTSSPTAPSLIPTPSPSHEFAITFAITYSYAFKESDGGNYDRNKEPLNVTEDVEVTATEFLNETIANTEGNDSCVLGSDFEVTINTETQEVNITGEIYACDWETVEDLLDILIENITSQLTSDDLIIVEDSARLLYAEPINEQRVATLSPTLMRTTTSSPSEDWKELIEEELENEESAFIYLMGGLGAMICCCVMAFCFLFILNAKKDWKRNAAEDTMNSKSRCNSDANVRRGYMIKDAVTKERSERIAKNIVPVYVDQEDDEQDKHHEEGGASKVNHSSASTMVVPQPGMVQVETKEDMVDDEVIDDDIVTPGQIEETPGDIQDDEEDPIDPE